MASADPVEPNGDDLPKTLALKTAMDDAIEGYEKMLEKAEPHFRPTVEELLAHHRATSLDLAAMLQDRGIAADQDGSLMGAVHKTVVTVRSMFDDVDEDLIPGIVDGERRNLEKFDEAMGENAADPVIRATVGTRRAELQQLVQQLGSRT